MAFYVRGFGCVENEVLNTYGKSALMHKKWTDRVELTKKTSHSKSRDFLRKRRLKTMGLKVFSIFMILDSYLSFFQDSWYLYASLTFLGHVLASGLKILTSKKVLQKRESQSPFTLMSNLASSSVVVVLSTKDSLPKVEVSAQFRHHSRLYNGGERVANFVVSHLGVYSFVAWREWEKLKSSAHGHIADVF